MEKLDKKEIESIFGGEQAIAAVRNAYSALVENNSCVAKNKCDLVVKACNIAGFNASSLDGGRIDLNGREVRSEDLDTLFNLQETTSGFEATNLVRNDRT